MESSSDVSSSNESLSVVLEEDCFPKPNVFTDTVQPGEEEIKSNGEVKIDINKHSKSDWILNYCISLKMGTE